MVRSILLLILLTSCAFFKSRPSLKTMDPEKLLASVKLTGEGRGRLGIGGNSYVFGFDALVKEDAHWLLAIAIPLQGEEVLELRDLRTKEPVASGDQSFERRIDAELRAKKLDKTLTGKLFVREFRGLVRFILRDRLGLASSCARVSEKLECKLDGEIYTVSTADEEIFIRRQFGEHHAVELVGQNLTGPIFTRNNFFLVSAEASAQKKAPLVSLELFWKD